MNLEHIKKSEGMSRRLKSQGLVANFKQVNKLGNPRNGARAVWVGIDTPQRPSFGINHDAAKQEVAKYCHRVLTITEDDIIWRVVKKVNAAGERHVFELCEEGANLDPSQPMFMYIKKEDAFNLYGVMGVDEECLHEILSCMTEEIEEYAAWCNKEEYRISLSPIQENPCMADGKQFEASYSVFNADGPINEALENALANMESWIESKASNTMSVSFLSKRGEPLRCFANDFTTGIEKAYGIAPVIGSSVVLIDYKPSINKTQFNINLNLLPRFLTIVDNNQDLLKTMRTYIKNKLKETSSQKHDVSEMLFKVIGSEDYDLWPSLLLEALIASFAATIDGAEVYKIEHVRKPKPTIEDYLSGRDTLYQAIITTFVSNMDGYANFKANMQASHTANDFIVDFEDIDDALYFYHEHKDEMNDFAKRVASKNNTDTLTEYTHLNLKDQNFNLDDVAIGLYEPLPEGLLTSDDDKYAQARRAVANFIIKTCLTKLYDEYQ